MSCCLDGHSPVIYTRYDWEWGYCANLLCDAEGRIVSTLRTVTRCVCANCNWTLKAISYSKVRCEVCGEPCRPKGTMTEHSPDGVIIGAVECERQREVMPG